MKFIIPVLLIFVSIIPFDSFAQKEQIAISLAPFSSSDYNEFAPVYYKGGIVFCTDRSSGKAFKYTTTGNNGLFKIYFADSTCKSPAQARLFSKEIVSDFNDGPACFNKEGNEIYYSRNQTGKAKLHNLENTRNKLGIFKSELIDGKWMESQEMRFNNEWYNITTPCLSPDGQMLIFASDLPGGYGGSDLYYSINKKGYWENPVNLGPVINTAGNEAYPFLSESGELFFSSDGRKGFGGKDIFVTAYQDGQWKQPVLLDEPINSPADDFALITDNLMTKGYFSSKRGKTVDIYNFKAKSPYFPLCDPQKSSAFCYEFDDDRKLEIKDEKLYFEWDFGDGAKSSGYSVNHCFSAPGRYVVTENIIDRATGNVFFTKLKYILDIKATDKIIISFNETGIVNDKINFTAEKSILPVDQIINYYWDFGDNSYSAGLNAVHSYKTPGEYFVKLGLLTKTDSSLNHRYCVSKKITISDTKDSKRIQVIKNNDTQIEAKAYLLPDSSISEENYSSRIALAGNAVFQLEIASSSSIIGINNLSKKYPFLQGKITEIYNAEENLYSYIITESKTLMGIYPDYKKFSEKNISTLKIKTSLSSIKNRSTSVKRIAGLFESIYYFPNEFNIPSGSDLILNQIVNFLKNTPGSRIEIAAYADEQKNKENNLILAGKRAQLIADYLSQKGIPDDRIVIIGFGKLKTPKGESSDKENQVNRKVEFTLLN